MTLYNVYDGKELVITLDDGCPNACTRGELCGGCDSCMLMQAHHNRLVPEMCHQTLVWLRENAARVALLLAGQKQLVEFPYIEEVDRELSQIAEAVYDTRSHRYFEHYAPFWVVMTELPPPATPAEKLRKSLEENAAAVQGWSRKMRASINTVRIFGKHDDSTHR